MFRVATRGFSQEFGRWTDALNTAKSLQPKLKSLLQDIRIFDGKDLVWVYDRLHVHPQYIGPGTYKRLALLFLQEAMEEEAALRKDNDDA
ncbi:MAG TPA: hypothetical protein V6D03_11605 [Candidatus Caenarcaniphilales bacterium]